MLSRRSLHFHSFCGGRSACRARGPQRADSTRRPTPHQLPPPLLLLLSSIGLSIPNVAGGGPMGARVTVTDGSGPPMGRRGEHPDPNDKIPFQVLGMGGVDPVTGLV